MTFILAMTSGELVARKMERFEYARIGPRSTELPDGGWYLDVAIDLDSLSHEVFYYGIGQSIRHARSAHILIFGNSRTNFAFPRQVMDEFARKHDIRFFNMALGHEENNLFAEYLITTHDLRPKFVIVNADSYFFVDRISTRAKEIMTKSHWERLKGKVESTGQYIYVRYLRRLFPHFLPRIPPPYKMNARQRSVLVRSVQDGTWFIWTRQNLKIPIRSDSDVYRLTEKDFKIARRFKELVEARGGNLILTLVPTADSNVSRNRAKALAAQLGVPFISPELTGLVTMDGSHLNQESADRFATAFLNQLESEPVFVDTLSPRSR